MQAKTNQKKTAFTPIRPKLNTELADRLIAQAEAARQNGQAASGTRSQPNLSQTPPSPIVVNLEVAVVNDPQKLSPAWGYIKPLTLGVVLNKAHEPTRRALACRDLAQIRWLAMLSIIQRLLGWHFREPETKVVSRWLWKRAERPENSHWDSMGVSFRLSKDPISAGIEKVDWNATGPQSFGRFIIN